MKKLFKKILPKSVWNFLRHYRAIVVDRVSNFGSSICTISYCGFTLYYSAGTILIKKIRNGKIFEEEMCKSISDRLSAKDKPILLDIGANIGLISLYVLSKVPSVKIFAFEPGPDQNKHFGITIEKNNLKNSITLSNKAVGEREERKKFMTHFSPDSSGDGFVDTGRAGEPIAIEVEVTTIDSWWKNNGMPKVDVVKIDIEGAELLAFRGATEFLKQARPVIYFEVEPKNLVAYGYTADDVLNWFKTQSYTVRVLQAEGKQDTYIAEPK